MFDGTSIHAHVSAAAQKEKKNQVLGRSRGEFGTKIHIKVDRDAVQIKLERGDNFSTLEIDVEVPSPAPVKKGSKLPA